MYINKDTLRKMANYLLVSAALLGTGYYFYQKSPEHYKNIATKATVRTIGYLGIYKDKFYKKFLKNNKTKIIRIIDENGNTINHINSANNGYELRYMQNGKKYKLYCPKEKNIDFPLYSTDELAKKNSFDTTSENIILLTIRNNEKTELEVDDDCVQIVKDFSGPKGNFYSDKSLYTSDDEKMAFRQYVLRQMTSLTKCEFPEDATIELMYSNGDVVNL